MIAQLIISMAFATSYRWDQIADDSWKEKSYPEQQQLYKQWEIEDKIKEMEFQEWGERIERQTQEMLDRLEASSESWSEY